MVYTATVKNKIPGKRGLICQSELSCPCFSGMASCYRRPLAGLRTICQNATHRHEGRRGGDGLLAKKHLYLGVEVGYLRIALVKRVVTVDKEEGRYRPDVIERKVL